MVEILISRLQAVLLSGGSRISQRERRLPTGGH